MAADLTTRFTANLKVLRDADDVARPTDQRDTTSLVRKDLNAKWVADPTCLDLNSVLSRALPPVP